MRTNHTMPLACCICAQAAVLGFETGMTNSSGMAGQKVCRGEVLPRRSLPRGICAVTAERLIRRF